MDRTQLLAFETGETRRPVASFELRAATDGNPNIIVWDGHASVTEHEYPVYGGEWPGWMETVANGSFKRTLRNKADVAFLLNHDGMTLARTKSGTLQLDEDDVGLHNVADLDRRQSVVADLEIAVERGDIDEMSFAFRVEKDEWFDDDGEPSDSWLGTKRRITEINLNKGDVSAVNYGANDAAAGGFRALDQAFAELRNGRSLTAEQRALVREFAATLDDHEPEADETDDGFAEVLRMRAEHEQARLDICA